MNKTYLVVADSSHFSVANHNGFNIRCLGVCQRHTLLINEPELIADYREKVEQEEYIFKWMRQKEYTQKKALTDSLRDDTYITIKSIIRTNSRHFDLSIVEAANHIQRFLDNYGDVPHADYDAETTAIDSIITHLKSDNYIQDVNLLNLMPWVDRLNDFNTQFKQYVEGTSLEAIKKPKISTKESRKQTDEALQKIISRVEALATLNKPDQYMPFITEYNELAEHYNLLVREHYGLTHVKIDINSVYIEPIPLQTFTGKPIIVIPELKLNKKTNEETEQVTELVFTEDFTVSFKNNINPGTAIIIIKGIGKYKGEIRTTFNIELKIES
jgi:hypothetical protein